MTRVPAHRTSVQRSHFEAPHQQPALWGERDGARLPAEIARAECMASKGVIERQQSADGIVSLLARRGQALASAAGEALGAPSFLLRFVPLLGELLAQARDGMLQADLRHEQELGANCTARDEGDGAAHGLNELLSHVRETMSVLYGADIAGKVFTP